MRTRSVAIATLVPVALASALLASTQSAQAAPTATAVAGAGGYHSLAQTRIVDTRIGQGAPQAPVGPNGTLTFTPLGQAGIQTTNVAAVVFNLTAVVPSQGTFITAYPAGPTKPEVSNLNTDAGVTRANQVTVPVGANGAVSLYNAFGSTDVLVDVLGWYDTNGTSGGLVPLDPQRIFDSRTEQDGPALGPGEEITTGISFGANTSRVTALAVNVTAIDGQEGGYISTWDGTVIQPTTSTVNYRAKDVVPNAAIIPVQKVTQDGTDYAVYKFKNISTGSTHVAVDLVGVYLDGQLLPDYRFSAITPTRVLDTRFGIGGLARFGQQQTQSGSVPASVATPDTYALAGNLTAVTPSGATYLTIWPTGDAQPGTSTVNANPGQTAANAALVYPDYSIFNAVGSTDVIVDVSGQFNYYNGASGQQAKSSAEALKASAKVQKVLRSSRH